MPDIETGNAEITGNEVLREKVDDYKKSHPEDLPELDYAFFLRSISRVNESSPVKIARNAFNDMREWIPGTRTYNVSGVFLGEDSSVTFVMSGSDHCTTVDALLDELENINKKLPLKNVPIMIQIDQETTVQATDLYAHSLVSDAWAGMPADFVLCYNQEKKPYRLQADADHSAVE